MLLIDKAKSPESMYDLWKATSPEPNYHDFSAIFRADKEDGWPIALELLKKEEDNCEEEHPEFMENIVSSKEPFPCIFELKERRKRKLFQFYQQIYSENFEVSSFHVSGASTKKSYQHVVSYRDYFDSDLITAASKNERN